MVFLVCHRSACSRLLQAQLGPESAAATDGLPRRQKHGQKCTRSALPASPGIPATTYLVLLEERGIVNWVDAHGVRNTH
eukprot:scaffold323_cov414-Prasinococcus_capsulatus_cf.AAC.4